MKKQILLILSIIVSTISFAQTKSSFASSVSAVQSTPTFGVRAGVLSSGIRGDAANNFQNLLNFTNGMVTTKNVTGFYAGGFANIPVSDMLSFEPSVSYAVKGYEMDGDLTVKNLGFLGANAKAKLQTEYIDITVLLKINAGGLQLFAGPQISYLMSAKMNMTAGVLGINLLDKSMDATNQMNRWDAAITGGIGYQFSKNLNISASYDYGLSKIDANQNAKAYNNAFKIGIGMSF